MSSHLAHLDTAPAPAERRPAPAQPRLDIESRAMAAVLAKHWPEYLMEAWALGTFMVAACLFTILLEHPGSPVRVALDGDVARRAVMGVAMGLTAVGIIYSPWGKRSGAHFNPAVTLTFLGLGKIQRNDALFYMAAHLAGGFAGVALVALVLPIQIAHPAVNYAVTLPGPAGVLAALVAEFLISFLLMTAILAAIMSRYERYTGLVAGALVALYITLEAPFSGMSMNPARTVASAVLPGNWTAFWIYVAAPVAGMLAAAAPTARLRPEGPHCAKLHHVNKQRCIFCGADGGA